MSAGTLALTNGSTTVGGTGTSFTTELGVGDFVYVSVGGTPYTLVVASISSNTSLTLSVAFDGPTTSGLAWNAVPASIRVAITQKVLNDFSTVARGQILEKANWQKIYTGTGNVTVTLPDGTTYTGPAWNGITTTLASKLDKSGGTMTGALWVPAIELAGGNTTYMDWHFPGTDTDYSLRMVLDAANQLSLYDPTFGAAVFRVLGAVTASGRGEFSYVRSTADAPLGNRGAYLAINAGTSRMGIYNNPGSQSGGFDLVVSQANGTEKMRWSGNIDGAIIGPLGTVTWQGSDSALKDAVTDPEGGTDKAIERLMQIRPREFDWKYNGKHDRGFIAQEMLAIDPRYANFAYKVWDDKNDANDLSGEKEGTFGLSDRAIMADAIAVIQSQQQMISSQNEAITDLQKRITAIEGAGS